MATYTNQIGDLTNFGLEVGDVLEYTYTGTNPSITLPKGVWQIECWGGAGGAGHSTELKGNGGYAVGTYCSNKEQLYIACGGQGSRGLNVVAGGYNGGGNATGFSPYYNGSGGGATHISFIEGLLRELETNKDQVLIVAGGGGGGGRSGSYYGNGGSGGGINGGDATWSGGSGPYGGQQTPRTNQPSDKYGGFGYGGYGGNPNPQTVSTTSNGAGAGGGWYGGCGSSQGAGGGGGSGYVNPTYLTDTSMSNGVNSDAGKITITYLSTGLIYTNQTGDLTQLGLQAGDVLKYTYTGTNPSITLPKGSYQLECYGGMGGQSAFSGATPYAYGGYSVGTYKISDAFQTLYLACGGNGVMANRRQDGGYNGGGQNVASGESATSGSGGGATHIALVEGLLSTLESQKEQVIIVAGGSGGRGNSNTYAGSGGGENGGNAYSDSASWYSTGGTQTEGGKGYRNNSPYSLSTGTFGKGGNGADSGSSIATGGGGGGWYGGGGGVQSSSVSPIIGYAAGGGSGYVSTTYLTDAMTQNNLNTTGDGSGYIQITVLNISVPNRYFVKVDDVWQELEVE